MPNAAVLRPPTLLAATALLLACRPDVAPSEPPLFLPRHLEVGTDDAGANATTVIVPPSMRSAPFDVPRSLTIPSGFEIAVYARVGGARFMTITPEGTLLVTNPGAGAVRRVTPNPGGDPIVTTLLSGLRKPHDMAFTNVAGTTYLYVAESHRVVRYPWNASAPGTVEIVVNNLPDGQTPGLRGAYGHELKNIGIAAGKLYISIASTCNVCLSDTQSNPVRASIYSYNLDGSGGQLFAQGLRNAEGLAFPPGSSTLWVVVNNRDNIPYPFNDASGNYGRVFSGYYDNHPPEEFTDVRLGGNYGWPFCNPNPDTPAGLVDMPFDDDYDLNRGGATANCATMDRIAQGIQAHSAPLGLTFLGGTNMPAPVRNGAAIALHGSWNRSSKTGAKVIWFPWSAATQRPAGVAQDLVSGWITNGAYWGRPVDVAADSSGRIFISDDHSGTIYALTEVAPPPGLTVTSLTLIDADTDQPVTGFDPIPPGAVISAATYPNINIRANVTGTAGSVVFALDTKPRYRVDNLTPFSLGAQRNAGRDYLPVPLTTGAHTVTATPWSATQGRGTAGTSFTLSFTR